MEKSLAEKISLDEETKESDTTATESLNTSTVSADSVDNETYSEDDIKKAEEYKSQGNDFFKCNSYQNLSNLYSWQFRESPRHVFRGYLLQSAEKAKGSVLREPCIREHQAGELRDRSL